MYSCMKMATYNVTNSEVMSNTIGKDFSKPPSMTDAKNSLGFCITITLPMEHKVDKDMNTTNLAGFNAIVGNPTTTAKMPQPTLANNK